MDRAVAALAYNLKVVAGHVYRVTESGLLVDNPHVLGSKGECRHRRRHVMMTHEQAKRFLESYQPITDDDVADPDVVENIGAMIEFYRHNVIIDDLHLLFSFIDDSDAVGYAEDLGAILLRHYPRDVVLSEISRALVGEAEGRAVWVGRLLWDIGADEAMRICKSTWPQADDTVRLYLAYAVNLACSADDAPWIRERLGEKTNDDIRGELDKALVRIRSQGE